MKLPILPYIPLLLVGAMLTACFETAPKVPQSGSQTSTDANRDSSKIDRSQVCRVSYINPAGDFKTDAIDVPFGSSPNAAHFRIGHVEYTHDDAQKLAPAAQEAEQIRLMYCLTTDPNVIARIPPDALPALLMEGMHAMENLHGFTYRILNATSVKEGQQAADDLTKASQAATADMANKVKQYAPDVPIPKAAAPGTPNTAPAMPPVPPAPSTAAITPANLQQLFAEVSALNKKLSEPSARAEIKVLGFASKGVSIEAAERHQLYNEFEQALNRIPPNQHPVILVVGYAQKSGPYLKNIDLSLRRAQAVMSFLLEQKFSRSYEGHVMSGGVDDTAYADRVDIFLTGA